MGMQVLVGYHGVRCPIICQIKGDVKMQEEMWKKEMMSRRLTENKIKKEVRGEG